MKKLSSIFNIISIFIIITLIAMSFTSCSENPKSEETSLSTNSELIENPENNENIPANSYDFTLPVPKSDEWVKKVYFDDSVFVGDSVSTGISIYEFMENSTVLAERGISPTNIFTKKCIDIDGSKSTIMEAVAKKEYSKIYILLGANSAEFMSTIDFKTEYGKVIDEFKKTNPKAKIYIQSVFPITRELSDKNTAKGSKFTNETIQSYNKALLELSNEKQVYFVNVFEAFANENNELPSEYSSDGVHIKATQYQLWFDYLRTHTVS